MMLNTRSNVCAASLSHNRQSKQKQRLSGQKWNVGYVARVCLYVGCTRQVREQERQRGWANDSYGWFPTR